jgi:putative endopeptidase
MILKTPLRAAAIAALLCCSIARPAAATGVVLEAHTMDRSADPCTNFFRYANGKWLDNNPVPPDRSTYSAYSEVSERNLLALKTIAENAAKGGSKSADLVGLYYRSGMDEARIEADGALPLADDLARINAIDNRRQLLSMLASLHQSGVNPLFNFSIEQDAKNTLRYLPQLNQGGLGLPDRDYYLKTDAKTREIRSKYIAHMEHLFVLLGDAPALAKRNAASVMRLETQLARASLTKVELRDPQTNYHLTQLARWSKANPQVEWTRYFQDIGLNPATELNLAQPKFFTAATHLLATLPLAEWKTYLRFQLVNARAHDLSAPFVNADFDFYGKTLAGTKELQPRWKRVLTTLDTHIGEALGQLYAEQFFGPAAKASVLEMVDNIKLAMRDSINDLAWMTPPTKALALQKLDRIAVKIGYPDQWRDYSSLKIDGGSFAANTARANEFEFKRELAKLGKPIDRNEWGMTPPTVNAYYNPAMNEIVFPAGILQPPLYHVEADPASNYGNTGATIGHEITHGFDDEGRQFDGDGNLKSWWSKDDEKNFLKRVAAIEQQFDAFVPIDQLHINGKLTAGENIADLGGLKIALKALKKSLAQHPQAALIDDLTPEQRFFVAYGQSFRGTMRPEKLRLQLLTDPHAPDAYRVTGPLANMPEFAAAFHCPAPKTAAGQTDKRVIIW